MNLHAANTPGPGRAPLFAALATAVPMLVVAGLWALMGLLGSNGMQGAKGAWFLFGHAGAGVLASGQVAGIIDDLPSCAELVPSIVAEAVEHLQKATTYIRP